MKASNATLGVLAVGAAAFLLARKHIRSTDGIGALGAPSSVLNKAKKLFDAKCDVIYENLQAQGIDPFADENERIVCNALYQAGLTDENGLTDVMMNRHNARKELLNFIIDNIIPYFPIPASDRALFKKTNNWVYQERLIDMTRNYVDKTLEHNRNIRETLKELGVGKVEHSDYDGARVISKDGRHAISFDIYGRGENGITVTSEMKGYGERYGFDWEFLSHIGDYKTLSGAIKAAKRYWNTSGIQYNEKDFERI